MPDTMIIKNTKKIFLFIFTLIFCLTFLSGCYDARGIEDMAYATALGLDISETNNLYLTLQFSIPGSGSSSDSGSSQSSKTDTTTVECSSINSGLSLINSYISKEVNLSHCKVIIFSEKLASFGLNDYIDTLSNNIELRPDCNVIISRCTAKEFIEKASPSIETLTARYYEVALKSNEYTGYTTATTYARFISDVKNKFTQGSAILGGLNYGENFSENEPFVGMDSQYKAGSTPISDVNNVETFGTAVFFNDKIVGELNGIETIYHLLISSKLQSCTLSIPSPFDSTSNIDLQVRQKKNTKINLSMVNGSPYISVSVFLEAHGLTLNENIDYSSRENNFLLENYARDYLKLQLESYLYKTSKSFNSDIDGFGKYALSKYLTFDEWDKSSWLENYKNAFFDVSVNISILSGSEFDKSP